MSPSIVILSAQDPNPEYGSLPLPDIQAWQGYLEAGALLVAAQTRGSTHPQLLTLGLGPTLSLAVAETIRRIAPDLLLIEWRPSAQTDPLLTLRQLKDLGFKGRVLSFGPTCTGSAAAARLLRRAPLLDGVLWGGAASTLPGLITAWRATLEGVAPPGVSLRQGRAISHGALPPLITSPSPSPWAAALTPLPGGVGALSLGGMSEDPGTSQARSHGEIKEDLDLLLGPMGVQDLLILPAPADASPHLLRWLLMELASRAHLSRVHLALSQLPSDPLSISLKDAGVRWLIYDPTAAGVDAPERRLGRPLLRSRIHHLRELGILTRLRIPVPKPGWTRGEIEGLVDLGLMAGAGAIDILPYPIPPGSPEAKNAKRRGLLRGSAPPYPCLGTPDLNTASLVEIRQWGYTLNALLPTFSGTLRALNRVTGGKASTLLRDLGEYLGITSKVPPIEDPMDSLLGAMGLILKDAGAIDALPALEDLAELEAAISDTHPPPPLSHDPATKLENFGATIPVLSPRAMVLTFAHDTLAILNGTPADKIPASRTDILTLETPRGITQAIPLPRLNRLALELVDGARSLDMLAIALADTFPNQGYDHDALLGIYADLLAMGAIIPGGTLEDPPAPELRDNILPFRKRKD